MAGLLMLFSPEYSSSLNANFQWRDIYTTESTVDYRLNVIIHIWNAMDQTQHILFDRLLVGLFV